jgi:hypothetical protein
LAKGSSATLKKLEMLPEVIHKSFDGGSTGNTL